MPPAPGALAAIASSFGTSSGSTASTTAALASLASSTKAASSSSQAGGSSTTPMPSADPPLDGIPGTSGSSVPSTKAEILFTSAEVSVSPRTSLLGQEKGSREGAPVFRELDLREKAISAAGAAFLSALIVTPLDVAKTRLQAQAAGTSYGDSTPSASWERALPSRTSALLRGQEHVKCPPACPRPTVEGGLPECPPSCFQYRGTWDVIYKVARQEGIGRLWRGTNAGLAIAIPTVGIYLPCYDVLREWLETDAEGRPTQMAPYAPLLAGSLSRSLACVVCSPLELARTRMQAQRELRMGVAPPGMWKTLQEVLSTVRSGPGSSVERVQMLWRGVGAQLSRDVPFSALCWTSLEPARRWLLQMAGPEPTAVDLVGANFVAGVLAGGLAAVATCPLDVAKTRRQIEMDPVRARSMNTVATLREVYRAEGLAGLFVGWVARTNRAALSTGIMISVYEVFKFTLVHGCYPSSEDTYAVTP